MLMVWACAVSVNSSVGAPASAETVRSLTEWAEPVIAMPIDTLAGSFEAADRHSADQDAAEDPSDQPALPRLPHAVRHAEQNEAKDELKHQGYRQDGHRSQQAFRSATHGVRRLRVPHAAARDEQQQRRDEQ